MEVHRSEVASSSELPAGSRKSIEWAPFGPGHFGLNRHPDLTKIFSPGLEVGFCHAKCRVAGPREPWNGMFPPLITVRSRSVWPGLKIKRMLS